MSDGYLSPGQRARTYELLRSSGEEGAALAELVAQELDADPVARELAGLRQDLRTELRGLGDGLREEQRSTTRNAFAIVALGMIVSAGISAGIAGLSQSVSFGGMSVETRVEDAEDGAGLLDPDTSPLEASPEF